MIHDKQGQRTGRFAALLACMGILALGGCEVLADDSEGQCTAIGCQTGLQINLQLKTAAQWPTGTYLLHIRADDGATISCTATLPFASISSGGSCSAEGVQLQTSGQALANDQHALVGVWISTTPAKVELELKRDGTVVASETLQPTYTTSRPNGPNCEPECTQANATVAVD